MYTELIEGEIDYNSKMSISIAAVNELQLDNTGIYAVLKLWELIFEG